MESRVQPQTPYEVYCHECHVTFPIGTRSCLHCGRPIGVPAAARHLNPLLPAGPGGDAEPADPLTSVRRLGGVSLWVLLAVGAALTRLCGGG